MESVNFLPQSPDITVSSSSEFGTGLSPNLFSSCAHMPYHVLMLLLFSLSAEGPSGHWGRDRPCACESLSLLMPVKLQQVSLTTFGSYGWPETRSRL